MTSLAHASQALPLAPATFPPIARMSVATTQDTAQETVVGHFILAGFSDVAFIRPTVQLASGNNCHSFRDALGSISLTKPNLAIDLSEQSGLLFDHISPALTDLKNAHHAALFVVTEDESLADSLRQALGAVNLTIVRTWPEVIRTIDARNIQRALNYV